MYTVQYIDLFISWISLVFQREFDLNINTFKKNSSWISFVFLSPIWDFLLKCNMGKIFKKNGDIHLDLVSLLTLIVFNCFSYDLNKNKKLRIYLH